MKIVLFSLLVVAGSIGIVRMIPSPERTAHQFGELFHVTPDKDAAQMRILPDSNEEKMLVEETQGSNCEPDSFAEGSCAPPYHYHTYQTEIFHIKEGAIRFKVNGKESVHQQGENVTVPPGVKHTLTKSGGDAMRVVISLEPNPHSSERFFSNLFGTIRDDPNPVQILYIFCQNGVRIADMPKVVHEALCVVLNVMAPLAGYHAEYPEYAYEKPLKSEEAIEEKTQEEEDL